MSKYSKTIATCAFLAASICLLIFAVNLNSLFLYIGIACLLIGVVLRRFSSPSSSSFEDQIEQAIHETDDSSSAQNK